MSETLIVAIIGSGTTVLVSFLGWVFAWQINRDTKRMQRARETIAEMNRYMAELRGECQTRIKHEEVAASALAEAEGITANQAKLRIRNLCEERFAVRPQLSSAYLANDAEWTW